MPLQMRVETADFAFYVWPIFAAALIVLLIVMRLKKRSFPYLACLLVFAIYLLFALDKTFFPLQISGGYADARRELPFWSDFNLIPFYFGPYSTLKDSLSTLILNILLTIPFGFGINFIAPVKAKTFLWLAPTVGIGIELAQFAISLILQYMYRYVDINDVIMNLIGISIGYGIFRVFAWVYIMMAHRIGIEKEGLIAYIYHVASRS